MHPDDIWRALDIALTSKCTHSVTLARLNELVRKRFGELPDNYLTQDNCEVWCESLTADQLRQCNPGHDRAEPHQMSGPVVVFEQAGERYMFDGTNRLNVWLRNADKQQHDAILLRRISRSNAVQTPAREAKSSKPDE